MADLHNLLTACVNRILAQPDEADTIALVDSEDQACGTLLWIPAGVSPSWYLSERLRVADERHARILQRKAPHA